MKELEEMKARLCAKKEIVVSPPNVVPEMIPPGGVLKLTPGVYETTGLWLPEKCALIATESGTVTIKLVPGKLTNPYMPTILARNSHLMEFYASGICFDCNWAALEEARAAAGGNFKLGAFALRCWQGWVDNCKVINFGADGAAYSQGNEVFPLRLDTYAGPGSTEALPRPCIEISRCHVSNPHFMNGGYCTAIFTQTNQGISQGDRFPIGTRTGIVAHIHDNYVEVPGGIALGCAESEQVLFDKNTVINSKCGFNFDTGSAYNVRIRANSMNNVSQGINCIGASRSLVIDENEIELGEPWIAEPQYAVNLQNNTTTTVERNTLRTDLLNPILGMFWGDGNLMLKKKIESNHTATIDTLNAQIGSLEKQIVELLENNRELDRRLEDVLYILGARETKIKGIEALVIEANVRIDELTKSLEDSNKNYYLMESKVGHVRQAIKILNEL